MVAIHDFMPAGFKPMLAAPTDDKLLQEFFAKGGKGFASVKLDGIRAVAAGGYAFSRSGKLIKNKFVQAEFERLNLPLGLDGELIVGEPNDPDVYRITESAVMSTEGEPDFRFYVFDVADNESPYWSRVPNHSKASRVIVHNKLLIDSYEALAAFEAKALADGYEGAMFRKFDGGYKFGRSTGREMHLMKLKRDTDTEVKVTGFEEAMHNGNAAFKDELGFTTRTSHQENKTGLGRVGAFLVNWEGKVLRVAPGKFKHHELETIWRNKEAYIGKLLKFRYFGYGIKDLPRSPRALGWRDEIDT